jgi:prephenate dehydrogenase
LINNIAIIGLGLIGGSIAKALKKANPDLFISGFDFEDVLLTAYQDKVIDSRLNKIEDALSSDLIVIALPVDLSIKYFSRLIPHLKEEQIITDVCSVKYSFKKIWDKSSSKGIYIGSHPMTGKEKGGYLNSDELLFENSIFVVTEDLSKGRSQKDFAEIIKYLGANILYIPAKQHDIIAASVSHLPQLVSIALVNTASLKTDDYNFLDLAAGGFRDMTRIASSDFSIWESIINENQNEILIALDKFKAEIDSIKKDVAGNNFDSLHKKFIEANKSRNEIPSNTKGFLTPLYDVFVFVKDEPGVLSKITTELFRNNINIKDLELLKIREGKGGTFRFSFSSEKDSQLAIKTITQAGFEVRH